jgi:ankyrin repeat protein
MFCSAIIIERSSRKYCLKPKKPSKLYWLQPGNQKVGDQVFSAFLAEDSAPKEYIKSVRDRGFDGQTSKIYLTVFFTVIGFIMQFIGLRGLHASVILASLGATLVMSILRTCLRTERMGPKENKLKDDREMTAYKQQELDCFAFQLAEENESVGLVSFSLHDILPDDSSPDQGTDHDNSMVKRLIQARVRLAELATTSDDGSTVPWDNMPIRSVAHKLSRTIETTMDLMSGWGAEFGESFAFPLALECEIKAGTPSQATYPVHLSRGGDSLRWRMNPNELEAVLGLWTWSLYRLEQDWRLPLYRLIGMDNVEAGKEATYLYFHKWIFRQTEARMVNLKMIDSSRRLFGFDADNFAYDSDILVMETENELDVMAAQDIYVHFIKIAFQHLTELGGDVDVSVGLIGDYVAENSRISDLVGCFENCQMGSREDALLCIVPALKDRGLIPSLAADSANIRARTDRLIRENAWVKAFHLVEWICQRSSGIDFDYSIFELGYLCRRALLSNVKAAQLEGFSYTCKILGSDTRKIFLQTPKTSLSSLWPQSPEDISSWHSFCKQIGWVAWRISKSIHGMEWIQDDLEKLNAHQDTGFSDATAGYKEQAVVGMQAMQQLLTFNPIDPRNSQPNPQDALGYWWAQGQGFNALLYFALSRWVELAAENQNQNFIQHAFTVTANCRSGYGIEILQRRGADIDALNTDKTSALMQVVDQQDTEGVQTLLEHGANPNGHDRVLQRRPLVLAAQRGCTAIVKLLLHHGARHEAFDSFGWSALYCAVSENHLETARVLLSYGADANKGSDGSTPLRSAVAANQIEMVELLTEHGADVNLSAGIGTSTVLMRAAELSHTDMVRLLLAKGANIHAKDSDGLTALDRARRENCEETVAILETAS